MFFNVLSSVSSLVLSYSHKKFFYRISGFDLTLDEIKHGLLRGNRKAPSAYFRTLSTTDAKAQIIRDFVDARINFVCLDYPDVIEHIDAFRDDSLDQGLDNYVAEIMNIRVVVDSVQGELTLPHCL